MFNSQKLNNDPKPWYVVEADDEHGDGRYSQRQFEESRDSPFHQYGGMVYNLACRRPRPEYDNNPNPILVAFREHNDNEMRSLFCGEATPRDWLGYADSSYVGDCEHVAHARKVLEKLVNVYGSD